MPVDKYKMARELALVCTPVVHYSLLCRVAHSTRRRLAFSMQASVLTEIILNNVVS